MSDDNARSGLESNPSPDGYSAMPSDLSVNGAARGQTPAWTPGPWKANAIAKGRIIGDASTPGAEKIQINNSNSTVATVYRPKDAHLIAAAPELAGAYESVSRALFIAAQKADTERDRSMYLSALEKCEAALSRARGECDSKGGA